MSDQIRTTRKVFAQIGYADLAIQRDLGGIAFALYTYLVLRAGQYDRTWPTYETIMEDLGIGSRATLRKTIIALQDYGVLQVEQRRRGGYQTSNLYIVHDIPESRVQKVNSQPRVQSSESELAQSSESELVLDSSSKLDSIKSAEDRPPLELPPMEEPKRNRNVIWDALVEVVSPPQTSSEKSDMGKTVKELKEVGATPDAIRGFAQWWVRTYGPATTLTHRCYRRNWADYLTSRAKPSLLDGLYGAEWGVSDD